MVLSTKSIATTSGIFFRLNKSAKKAEAEDVLKKLLASGVSADEILAKLK